MSLTRDIRERKDHTGSGDTVAVPREVTGRRPRVQWSPLAALTTTRRPNRRRSCFVSARLKSNLVRAAGLRPPEVWCRDDGGRRGFPRREHATHRAKEQQVGVDTVICERAHPGAVVLHHVEHTHNSMLSSQSHYKSSEFCLGDGCLKAKTFAHVVNFLEEERQQAVKPHRALI